MFDGKEEEAMSEYECGKGRRRGFLFLCSSVYQSTESMWDRVLGDKTGMMSSSVMLICGRRVEGRKDGSENEKNGRSGLFDGLCVCSLFPVLILYPKIIFLP